jgi:superfamily I DNA/RNA helicase
VERRFNGPARVAGSAGTGKTVVALHRVNRILRDNPEAKILLTTFSEPLARNLGRKLELLLGEGSPLLDRVSVHSFESIARQLYSLIGGREPHVAQADQVRSILEKAAVQADVHEVTPQFLNSEWSHVVDPWQIDSAEAYAQVPRMGRKNRLGPKQRERLWTVFGDARKRLQTSGLNTKAGIFAAVTAHYVGTADKPFTHVVVDEAQDLGVAELRFIAAIAPAQQPLLCRRSGAADIPAAVLMAWPWRRRARPVGYAQGQLSDITPDTSRRRQAVARKDAGRRRQRERPKRNCLGIRWTRSNHRDREG